MARTFPHILPDSRALVRDLESMTFTDEVDSMYLITGDVEGLYVKIPINVALKVIGGFLAQILARGGSGARAACQATWLRRAMHLVFCTMSMRFGTRYYKQAHGFPMGSPLSPDAANLFMALIEDVFGEWQHAPQPLHNYLSLPECLKLFKRLIDDYTVVLAGVSRLQVNTFLNELDRRLYLVGLKVTWVVHTQFCDTLDLHVYKPEGMRSTGKLAFRTHHKVGNRYQYLARSSMHNPQVFSALVRGELYRHAVNCSSHAWFWHMAQLFRHRLLARGYLEHGISAVFDSVQYSVRTRFLYGAAAPEPPLAGCAIPLRMFFKLPYDGTSASMHLGRCMHAAVADVFAALWLATQGQDMTAERSALMQQLNRIKPMVSWRRAPSLGRVIMHSGET